MVTKRIFRPHKNKAKCIVLGDLNCIVREFKWFIIKYINFSNGDWSLSVKWFFWVASTGPEHKGGTFWLNYNFSLITFSYFLPICMTIIIICIQKSPWGEAPILKSKLFPTFKILLGLILQFVLKHILISCFDWRYRFINRLCNFVSRPCWWTLNFICGFTRRAYLLF